jgi:trans-aconitate methyltransferase
MAERDQVEYWQGERHLAHHRRQFAEPSRSIVALCDFVERRVIDRAFIGCALDVGCGAGANMLYIGRRFPNLTWTGVDIASELFALGEELLREHRLPVRPRFAPGDAFRLYRKFC